MKATMHPDWRKRLRKSRSIKLASVATAASGLQIALPYLTDVIPAVALAVLSMLAALGAIGSRLLHNPGLDE
jgi:hypothetical protein